MPPGPFELFRPKDLDEKGREAALADPGPTWGEYMRFQFAKVWIGLGFFVADVIIVTSFVNPFQPFLMIPALLLALYAEFLMYRYLWYRPEVPARATGTTFHPTWTRPVEFGRWTPEMDRVRRGMDPFGNRAPPTAAGPDPREFI